MICSLTISNHKKDKPVAIAAEKRILAALNMIPPKKALPMLDASACFRSAKKLLPSLPKLPNVSAEIREKSQMPIT